MSYGARPSAFTGRRAARSDRRRVEVLNLRASWTIARAAPDVGLCLLYEAATTSEDRRCQAEGDLGSDPILSKTAAYSDRV